MERKTRQRDAIREVFEEHARPMGPVDVHEFAKSKVPGMGIATVYRNLKALIDEEYLTTIELPGIGGLLYERADKHHHHYFYCRECNRFFDIEACPGDLNKLLPTGFALENHEIMLSGLCDQCA